MAAIGDEPLTEEREPSPFTAVEDINFIQRYAAVLQFRISEHPYCTLRAHYWNPIVYISLVSIHTNCTKYDLHHSEYNPRHMYRVATSVKHKRVERDTRQPAHIDTVLHSSEKTQQC